MRILGWTVGLCVAFAIAAALVVATALAMAYPNLPDVSELSDYRPKLPLRVYTSEGALLGEFGEERRSLLPIAEIPQVMKDAVLAAEDANFYRHSGVDYKGMVRAALANLNRAKSQGASTITMQVARNVYLSSEKTFTRKIYEVLLTFKMEHLLSKDQILEIYMNQIYLGNHAYGFAAASEAYFGKPLRQITVAEAAMLAGLPKAPTTNNPISNPRRAQARQAYIIDRMQEHGFITAAQADAARHEALKLRTGPEPTRVHGEYIAEMVRKLVFAQYGNDAYTRGLSVYTSVSAGDQEAAYQALRKGLMDYERRQIYRGPEQFVTLPASAHELEDTVDDLLADHPDNGDVLAALVTEAAARRVVALRPNGERIEITGDGLRAVQAALSPKAAPNVRIRPGAIIRVAKNARGQWEVTQIPEVEGAFVALDPRNGAIRALVGGFDFNKNKFNHVTQAWRQPGSSFKPFIYSAALDKGFTPSTVINDGPLFFDAATTGGQPWEPKNYGGGFEGPMSMRRALEKSKNMVSIRILQAITPKYAQDYVTRFGFDAERHPAYLPMALGAGAVTPMQMAGAYAVFANGGHRVNPWIIAKITDYRGRVLVQTTPAPLDASNQAIDPRNAFVTGTMLQSVARVGTAARAQQALKRPDIYGKTGTTNDSMDAWFAGYQPTLVAITWIGYDQPRNLGDRETGGGLSLPVWIHFMEYALQGVPVTQPQSPAGLTQVGSEWWYDEYLRNGSVRSLGGGGGGGSNAGGGDDASQSPLAPPQAPPPEERNRILDLFHN